MYHANMFAIFTFLSHLSEDRGLPIVVRNDLMSAAEKIAHHQEMDALTNLAKKRALYIVAQSNIVVYKHACEALALTIVSHSQSLIEIEEIKKRLGPFKNDIRLQMIMLARSAGLKDHNQIAK